MSHQLQHWQVWHGFLSCSFVMKSRLGSILRVSVEQTEWVDLRIFSNWKSLVFWKMTGWLRVYTLENLPSKTRQESRELKVIWSRFVLYRISNGTKMVFPFSKQKKKKKKDVFFSVWSNDSSPQMSIVLGKILSVPLSQIYTTG